MKNKEDYPKPIITIDQQIALLKSRNMNIENEKLAKTALKNISYFRLQAYWWEYQSDKNNHYFKDGTSFNDVIDLYNFDSKLRFILFHAVEKIEIALRTKLIYYMSLQYGHWWYEDKSLFFNEDYFNESLDELNAEIQRSKESFLKIHFDKYGDSFFPPAYKALEIVSFGFLSKLYQNLNNEISAKDRIAQEFNLPNSSYLKSWMLTFNIVRNIVAHHGRLYNRNIEFAPKSLYKTDYNFIEIPSNLNSIYHVISCMIFVLNKVTENHNFKRKIKKLLYNHSVKYIKDMGFPDNWESQKLWK